MNENNIWPDKVAIVSNYDFSELETEINDAIRDQSKQHYKLKNSAFTTTYDQKVNLMLHTAYLTFA